MVNIIGRSGELQNVLTTSRLVAATDATILINGESGTGKELVAQYIHQNSPRGQGAFATINCAAIPESIAESELFGHKRGAYTNAFHNFDGKIRTANGGTLFLDEIAELPLSIQGKLLRFLETKECQAVGDSQTYTADVRIIGATNKSLHELCQQGKFREDLFYRLNVVPVQLPSLRERNSDIILLIKHFVDLYTNQYKLVPPVFDDISSTLLKNYAWPGNIRELKNFCERMVILFTGKVISKGNLPLEIQSGEVSKTNVFELFPESGVNLNDIEKQFISVALNRAKGNYSKAARLLGLTRDTLLYRVKKYSLSKA